MGDRTYARISIPAHHLRTQKIRAAIAEVFRIPLATLLERLAETPADDEYAYETGIRLRLVRGIPCLVWEDDQANYGANEQETALAARGIPFLLTHGDGGEYSAGCVVCDGVTTESVEVNRSDAIVVEVLVTATGARVDPRDIASVNAYLAIQARVLSPPVPNPVRLTKPRKDHT